MHSLNKIVKVIIGIAASLATAIFTPWNKINEISFFNYKNEPSFKFDGNKALSDFYEKFNEKNKIKDLFLENNNLKQNQADLENTIINLKQTLINKDLRISNLEANISNINHHFLSFFNENFLTIITLTSFFVFSSLLLFIKSLKLKKKFQKFHEINNKNNQTYKEILISIKESKKIDNLNKEKLKKNKEEFTYLINKLDKINKDLKSAPALKIDNESLKKKIRKTFTNSSENLKENIKKGIILSENINFLDESSKPKFSKISILIAQKHYNIRTSVLNRKKKYEKHLLDLTQTFISNRDIDLLKKNSIYLFYNSIFAISVCFLFKIGLLDSFRDGFLVNLHNMNFLQISNDPYLKIKDFSELNSSLLNFNEIMLEESSRDLNINLAFLDQSSSNIDSLDNDLEEYKKIISDRYKIMNN